MQYVHQSVLKKLRLHFYTLLLVLVAWSILFGVFSASAWAAERTGTKAPTQQPLIEVRVHLGNAANELKFEPSQLTFEAGKRYKLFLDNPSSQKHYFTAKDFADSIWTQKVEAGSVEVKGAIDELELKSGAEAEWVFVAMKPGDYELHCSILGHAEAGMTGSLTIK